MQFSSVVSVPTRCVGGLRTVVAAKKQEQHLRRPAVRYHVFHILLLAFISGAQGVCLPAVTAGSVISWRIPGLLGEAF